MGARVVQHLASTEDGESEIIVLDDRTLEDAQADERAGVDRYLDGLVQVGRIIGGVTYQIDDASRNNIAGVAVMAALVVQSVPGIAWPAGGYPWIAEDNSQQLFTPAAFLQFGQNIAAYYTALVLRARSLKDAINAAGSVEDVMAIDITEGWPVNG